MYLILAYFTVKIGLIWGGGLIMKNEFFFKFLVIVGTKKDGLGTNLGNSEQI